jgi:hypothetical protein
MHRALVVHVGVVMVILGMVFIIFGLLAAKRHQHKQSLESQ